jgi:hypothetical protein
MTSNHVIKLNRFWFMQLILRWFHGHPIIVDEHLGRS